MRPSSIYKKFRLSSIFSLPAPVESCFDTFTGWVGGWFRSDNKAKLSPAGAGAWAELGNKLSPAGAGAWAELGKIGLYNRLSQTPFSKPDFQEDFTIL